MEPQVKSRSTEFVDAPDGTRIAYRRLGSGPPIVALHGGLGSSRTWEAVARRLADRNEFFLVDRRGRGESDDGTEPHALAREVEDARAVLAAAGRGALLMGHSYGGAIALELAREAFPGELGSLILYEPAVHIRDAIPHEQLDRLRGLIAAGLPEQAVPYGLGLLDAAGLVSGDGPASTRPLKRTPELTRVVATIAREIDAVNRLDADPLRYGAIDVPALLLIGSESPARTQGVCRTLAQELPDVEVVRLDGVGHVAHTMAPDVVAGAIRAFLD